MTLGERMKKYEHENRVYLDDSLPIIVRLDGKAFHTFTKGFERPFDGVLQKTMQLVMKELCEEMQGAMFGYTQSDEITIVLYHRNPRSHLWFNGNIQKIVSVSASLATLYFNKYFKAIVEALEESGCGTLDPKLYETYKRKYDKAIFDSRAFNVPTKEEVLNCLIWRQLDAMKNSVQMVAQNVFSHKSLQGMHGGEIQKRLKEEKDIHWDKYRIPDQRGASCILVKREIKTDMGTAIRRKWKVDLQMPILTEDREYVVFREKSDIDG